MGAVEQTGAPPKPAHGSRCPRCNNGVLYLVALTASGELLRCFNCDTSGSVPSEGDWSHVLLDANHAPTGFQLTPEQLAAKREEDIDPYAPLDHPAFPSTTSSTPADTTEPHEQHDVAPPADETQQQPEGGGGG